MIEQLISFETAKLAKEKGFEESCFCYYTENNKLNYPFLENGSSTDVEFRVDLEELLENNNSEYYSRYSAPTQSLLQKWLREVHKINICIQPTHSCYYIEAIYIYNEFSDENEEINIEGVRFKDFISYEEALEYCLLEGLKLIK